MEANPWWPGGIREWTMTKEEQASEMPKEEQASEMQDDPLLPSDDETV